MDQSPVPQLLLDLVPIFHGMAAIAAATMAQSHRAVQALEDVLRHLPAAAIADELPVPLLPSVALALRVEDKMLDHLLEISVVAISLNNFLSAWNNLVEVHESAGAGLPFRAAEVAELGSAGAAVSQSVSCQAVKASISLASYDSIPCSARSIDDSYNTSASPTARQGPRPAAQLRYEHKRPRGWLGSSPCRYAWNNFDRQQSSPICVVLQYRQSSARHGSRLDRGRLALLSSSRTLGSSRH